MPCLTQALTRQPVGEPGSGSAARTSPRESAAAQLGEGRARLVAAAAAPARATRSSIRARSAASAVAHARAPAGTRPTLGEHAGELLARLRRAAGPWAAGSVSSSRPISAIAAFTGIGFDSAKFASMRGRRR